jgi:hypothetical protein
MVSCVLKIVYVSEFHVGRSHSVGDSYFISDNFKLKEGKGAGTDVTEVNINLHIQHRQFGTKHTFLTHYTQNKTLTSQSTNKRLKKIQNTVVDPPDRPRDKQIFISWT